MALMVAARLAARGRRKGSLDDADCQELPSMCRPAAEVMAAAEAAWAAELQRKRPRGPQVWRVVWAVVWRPTCVGLTCNVLRGCGNAFSLPLLIRAIVQAIVEGDAGRMSFFLVLLLLERALGATLEHWGTRVLSMAVPSGMTLSLSGLVLRKAATLSPGVAQAKSLDPVAFVGREVNMLYMKLGMSIANGAVAMPSLFAGTLTLFLLLGPAAVFGVVWVFFTIRVGTWLMTVAKKSEVKMSSIASDRLSKLSNIVGAVKAIKYFTWEPEFIEEMAAARMKECEALQAKLRLSSMTFTLGKITPVTGALITFVSFALLGNPLQAAEVFAANSVFLTMRFAVGASGMLVEVYKTMQVVNGRAQQLLLLPERPVRSLLAPPPPQDAPVLASAEELRVVYESGDESKDTFVLRGPGALCLARSGQLTAVCGLVGSGKSTILQALLGACDSKATVSGQCRAVESVGWSPQKPFIISGTIRDNILMGRPYDGPRMARCIADACLGRDLELLRDGMEEVIGERGTTLSGGQQARLSLARAMYGEPALLVLDDPLAAVDASVGRAILRALRLRCASPRPGGGSPPGALVVLNQLQVLPNFDQIVVVRAGVVEQCGSWSEFTQHPASIDLMKSVETQTFALDIEDDERVAQSELERAGKHAGGKDLDDLVMSKVSTARSLITKEQAATGLVKWPVLKAYLLAPGGFFLFGVVALFLASFVMLGLRDWWLSVWADADNGKDAIYVWVFSLFSLLHIGGAITGVFAIAVFAKRAGARIHSDCINKLMHAPMSFFDETPSGRIVSRFGTDLAMVDGSMPGMIDFTMTFGFTWLMMCITIAANVPWMITIFSFTLVLSIPIIQGLCTFQQDIKRQSNNAMAPVLSNLSEVQSGAALVDSLGCTSFFFLRHQELIDWWIRLSNATLFTRVVADTWIQMVHFLVLLVVGLLTLRGIDHYRRDPGLVAMFFSYAALWGIFATITMNVIMMLITNLTSLERLLEYTLGDLPQEPPWSRAGDPDHKAWPSAGAVSFEGVKIRYRAGLPCALDGLDLRIRGGERLGVVGRTGAGKSTITGALFRLVDCEEGRILVDGVDVSTLGLHTLRRAISMIPQEPIVMSGTVRYNLDPFGRHSDRELLEAMSVVGLAPAVQLEAPAGSGNLSAGQRQLLTFGRTTLQSSRLVVMDEPTASVDVQTDRAVQTAAREAFWGRTVVTIAHRLDTVKDCDRLAVIDAGRLVELGPYEELLQNPASYLSLLVRAEAAGAADRAAGGAAVHPAGGGGGAAPQSGQGPQCGGSAGASAGRGAAASCLGFPFCLPA